MQIDFSPELWKTIFFCVKGKQIRVQSALDRKDQEAVMDIDFTLNEIAQEEEITQKILFHVPSVVEMPDK